MPAAPGSTSSAGLADHEAQPPGILLFGGSFDPIHHGHLIVSRSAAEQLGVARTVLIPSAQPPHKLHLPLAPARDRLEMCRLAAAGDPLFEVSDWELKQAGPNYSLRTVEHFRQTLPPGTPLYWLIGQDTLAELATWYRVGELAALCTFVTAGRPGHAPPDLQPLAKLVGAAVLEHIQRHILTTPLIEISATDVRERIRRGRSARDLVPPTVERYIAERGLYR
jgi:nicotinate-nucleotide adenylyltransferase